MKDKLASSGGKKFAPFFAKYKQNSLLASLQVYDFLFALAVLGLIALRFLHFSEHIDDPHSWRQADTANYIWDYYKHGLDLLAPSVCWMGWYKTLILEFPLPEAIIALVYKIFGPDLLWARTVFLLFYLGSAYYLHRLVSYLSGVTLARITTLIYLVMPLSLFYSRAIHIDFTAVFFSHAMLYYLVRGIDENRSFLIITGVLLGTLGFLIKAPYVFYLFFPFAWHAWKTDKVWQFLKWIPILAIPAVSFILWRIYVEKVNSAAPDWNFLPGYYKFVDMGFWYFGTLDQRWNLEVWKVLLSRLTFEVSTPLGLLLLIYGFFIKHSAGKIAFFKIWWLSTFVYLLIFLNLNYHHNYYQIPFLAPSAYLMALAIYTLDQKLKARYIRLNNFPAAILLLLISVSAVGYAETNSRWEIVGYYSIDWVRIRAGQIIRENTPKDALIFSVMKNTNVQDPRLLYQARRNGWSLDIKDLTADIIFKLKAEGADYLALIGEEDLDLNEKISLAQFPKKEYQLNQQHILRLYRLKAAH